MNIGQEKAAGVEKGVFFFPALVDPFLSRSLRLQFLF